MSGVTNIPTSSVYGDTGSVNASYIKDLNQIGTDPYVNVRSSSGDLNVFQQFQITDNYYDSRYEELYVTNLSASNNAQVTSIATIQGNTMGWTRTDNMYLQIPVTIQTTLSGLVQGANANAYDTSDIYPLSRLDNMVCPDFAFMELFNRISIYIGNNNQPAGRTQSFFKAGMKNMLREIKTDQNISPLMGGIGLSQAQTQSAFTSFGAGTPIANNKSVTVALDPNTCYPQAVDQNLQQLNYFRKVLMSTSQWINGSAFAVSPAAPKGQFNTTTYNLILPLWMINSFFRHKQYIPPDFKLKIDIEGYKWTESVNQQFNYPVIGISSNYLASPAANIVNPISGNSVGSFNFIAGLNISAAKLVYVNHTLRQPLQQQINEKWITYPFLYNYETYENYDVDNSGNSSGTQITRDIAISQQRPTQLIFVILDQNTSDSVATAVTGATNINETSGVQFKDSISGDKGAANQLAGSQVPQILTISTILGGRTQYYYKNDTTVYQRGNNTPNAYDILTLQQNRECYINDTTVTSQRIESNQKYFTPFGGSGNMWTITIAPGGYCNTGSVPSDLGASVIRVIVNLSAPLNATKKLQIWKKLPEQIAIDTNKNATLIMWPAIKSNAGFIMPNIVNAQ